MSQPLLVQAMGGAGTDEYGNTVPGALGLPATETGFLEQKDTVEYQTDRETVVSKWTAYLPADSIVTALAQITFNGQVFQVDGAPWPVFNPRTQKVSHIECKLTVVA
ncbi:hypothetical protein [Glaciihabitans sp. UYNi722]|uniref:hypothetical protein n=1 Tax=Glaciihabitans sp. UYNi722 TaxID=3156344 RepID=UPI003396E513